MSIHTCTSAGVTLSTPVGDRKIPSVDLPHLSAADTLRECAYTGEGEKGVAAELKYSFLPSMS